jgi:hypothetical protein
VYYVVSSLILARDYYDVPVFLISWTTLCLVVSAIRRTRISAHIHVQGLARIALLGTLHSLSSRSPLV